MKSCLLSLVFITLILQGSIIYAQNTPNGWGPSAGSVSIALPANYNASPNTVPALFNFTRQWVPRKKLGDTTGWDLHALSYIQVNTTYTNGWNRPLETVSRYATSTKDLVQASDGRQLTNSPSYLPYNTGLFSKFQPAPFTAQKSFYNTLDPVEGDYAYSRTSVTSNATSGTTITNYPPGISMTGANRGTSVMAVYNTNADAIRIWTIDAYNMPVTSATYAAGELHGTKTLGQHGAVSTEWTDKSGQVVCRQVVIIGGPKPSLISTYYVYNDLGKLRFILTPKAVAAITVNSWQATASILSGLCYTYMYNNYGQLCRKTIPGKNAAELTIYDLKHRPVLSQTPLMYAQNKWAFNVYDAWDRVVFSGFTTTDYSYSLLVDAVRGITTSVIPAPTTPIPSTLLLCLVNGYTGGSYPASAAGYEINDYNYYDDYNFPGLPCYGRSFDNCNAAEYQGGDFFFTPQASPFVQGMLTAKKTRVIDPGASAITWEYSIFFYDAKGRVIQTHTCNPWNTTAWDINTIQYDFSGNPVLNVLQHNAWPGNTKTATKIIKLNTYSAVTGRLSKVEMKTDNETGFHTIASYDYDALGHTLQKTMGGGAEIQNYAYNIRGQLAGINPDYAQGLDYADQHFGCALNYDYGFSVPRYDGAISGMIWRGTGTKKAYGYNYDVAGRMTGADYREFIDPAVPNPTAVNPATPYWNNQLTDYGVSNVQYDANGNLTSMKQRGVGSTSAIPTPHPVDMDDLSYTYNANSNQLSSVADAVTIDYQLHDFMDNNTSGADYGYDADGNLKSDANKGVTNISYNELDLPLSVITASKGTIANIYDATGTLIQKTVTFPTGTTGTNPWVYRYWGPFTYRNDSLLYFLHEEGRARWMPDSAKFKYDYFVKDHLGNVRATVTSDVSANASQYLATHELASANLENLLFSNIDQVRTNRPAGTTSNDRAARLNGKNSNTRIGTSVLLQVMAGDRFNLSTDAYYDNSQDAPPDVQADAASMLSSLITTLSGGAGGFGGGEGGGGLGGGNEPLLNRLFSAPNYNAYDALKETMTNSALPRSYLNYVLFDENMQLVPGQSGAVQVSSNCVGGWGNIGIPNDVVVPVNGYLAVYISNEAQVDVFYDNVKVLHYRGRLLEEEHYYPFGLTIRAGSANPVPNRFLYQGKELQDEVGLELYDFHARQYDPQIGRFWGIDPADQFPSGYTGMGNDPGNQIDPDGCQVKGYQNSYVGENGTNNGLGNGASNPFGEDFWTTTDAGDKFDDRYWLGYSMTMEQMLAAEGGGEGKDEAKKNETKAAVTQGVLIAVDAVSSATGGVSTGQAEGMLNGIVDAGKSLLHPVDALTNMAQNATIEGAMQSAAALSVGYQQYQAALSYDQHKTQGYIMGTAAAMFLGGEALAGIMKGVPFPASGGNLSRTAEKEVFIVTREGVVIASESILHAECNEGEDEDMHKFYAKWKGGMDDIVLKSYFIEFNSTGSKIKIISKGFKVEKLNN